MIRQRWKSEGASALVVFALASMPATPVLVCAPAASAAPPEQAAQSNGPRLFHGVGVVVAVDPAGGSVTIDHQAIPDLMDAMVMEYNVATPALLHGIRKGDHVAFDLDGRTYTILHLSRAGTGHSAG
jgi:Cu/Ag efflux protein CusF